MQTNTDERMKGTLVERFDFITAERVGMEGIAEFEVTITEESVLSEIVEDVGLRAWIEHAVTRHFDDYLQGGRAYEARAARGDKELLDLSTTSDDQAKEAKFSVWVKFG